MIAFGGWGGGSGLEPRFEDFVLQIGGRRLIWQRCKRYQSAGNAAYSPHSPIQLIFVYSNLFAVLISR